MKIIIMKNEEGKPVVSLNSINEVISYETFEKIIDTIYFNDEEIEYETDPDLKEYEKLIANVVKMARTADFRDAVTEANAAKKELDDNEKDSSELL